MSRDETEIELREIPAAFARRIGVSKQRVDTLLKRGLPRGQDGRIPVEDGLRWTRANVVPQRRLRRSPQPCACPACGNPLAAPEAPPFVPEPIFRAKSRVLAGYLTAAHAVMCKAEPTVAAIALAEGASVRLAHAIATSTVLALAEMLEEGLGSDAPWLDTRFLKRVDWRAVAQARGEPDPAAS